MLRKRIFSTFVRRCNALQFHPIFQFTSQLLETILGLATFSYGNVRLLAGPVGYLDRYIIQNKNINPLVTSALSQYLNNGGVFLDIGANHGVLSLLAARNPKVQVIAFEPSPRELQRLWKNLSLNPTNNISVLSYGLGNSDKQQNLILTSNKNPGMNSLPTILKDGDTVSCHFSRLDTLLSDALLKKTRLIKLDVEGQEMLILNSLEPCMHLLNHCVFVIEISPKLLPSIGFSAEDIYTFFDKFGFHSLLKPQPEWHQWDEFFYHPQYSDELIYNEDIN